MGADQPGNAAGYGMVPPFLPPMVDLKGVAGLHEEVRTGEINPVIAGFHIAIECFRRL
jgi:hypothetical protein